MMKSPIKTIALCSTARFVDQTVISEAKNWLNINHFNVLLASNLNLQHHQFGGDDANRTQAFQELIDNPNIDAIWCLRGGYGTVRIMDNLNWETFIAHPKLLIGFSDFTILLNHVLQFNMTSIHAPMPIQFSTLEESCKDRLLHILNHKLNPIIWKTDTWSSDRSVSGKLIGGNLSMLYSFIGSASYPSTDHSILFIEDLDEYSYHLDRVMYGLLRSGSLNHIKAILVGSFTDIHDHKIPFGESYQDIFSKFSKHLNIPIYFNFPAGHINNNQPIVLGKHITISTHNNQSHIMTYDE